MLYNLIATDDKTFTVGVSQNNILDDLDFEFFVSQTLCLIKKDPLHFMIL